MRILLVTGKLAYGIVSEVASEISKKYGVQIDVIRLNYPVAALMTSRYIAEELRKASSKDLSKYDVILIPGLSWGDAREIEKVVGTKVWKGTEDAYDLEIAVKAILDGVKLSETEPADIVLRVEKTRTSHLRGFEVAFEINGLKFPLRSPPFLIFLELDATKDFKRELNRVKDFVDVPVLGYPAGFSDRDAVKSHVKALLEEFPLVGVDSDSPEILEEAVRSGAGVVLNLTEENYEKLSRIKKDPAFVVAPADPEFAIHLPQFARKVAELGFERIIVDPILSPPPFGLVRSLANYLKLTEELREFPFMMGTLNVTELIDADSPGINALLVSMALELGVSVLLTREGNKTRWSTAELRLAAEMATLSGGKSYLKDLGLDLLVLKDKKRKYDQIPVDAKPVTSSEPVMDRGYVRVYKGEDEIGVEWIEGDKRIALRGRNGLYLARELVRTANPSPEHAVYIGYELAKAEIALALDKNYTQDAPLFTDARSRLLAVRGGYKAQRLQGSD
ncbi:MAG: dihydropteroate synthase-like protein [Thermoprotei archaeon]